MNKTSGLYLGFLYKISYENSSWVVSIVDSFQRTISSGLIGDCDSDGFLELLINQGYYLVYLKWANSEYSLDTIGRINSDIDRIVLCDLNSDGYLEVYCKGYNLTPYLYFFTFNDNLWIKDSIALPYEIRCYDIKAGDGNNDGYNEIYIIDNLKRIYEISHNSNFNYITQLTWRDYPRNILIFDGNKDGYLELFGMESSTPDPPNYFNWETSFYALKNHSSDTGLTIFRNETSFDCVEPYDTNFKQISFINHWFYDVTVESISSYDSVVFNFPLVFPCIISNYDSIISDIFFTPVDTGYYNDSIALYTTDSFQPIHKIYLSGRCIYNVGVDEDEPLTTSEHILFSLSSFSDDRVIFNLLIPTLRTCKINIYDISGRLVSTPFSGTLNHGSHQISFYPERAGMYFFRLESDGFIKTGKFTMLR